MALAVVVLWATPTFAHTVMLQTTPGAGEILTTSPKAITLRYNEAVEADLGSVRVYDQKGNRVDTSSPAKPSADVVSVNIRSKLGDGSYLRHVAGDLRRLASGAGQAYAFQVGTAANATSRGVEALQTKLLSKESSDHTVGTLFGIDRGVLFGGIALLLGGVAFCAIVWGPTSQTRRTARIVWAGSTPTFVATIGGILLQGPPAPRCRYATWLKVDVLRDVVDWRFGHLR